MWKKVFFSCCVFFFYLGNLYGQTPTLLLELGPGMTTAKTDLSGFGKYTATGHLVVRKFHEKKRLGWSAGFHYGTVNAQKRVSQSDTFYIPNNIETVVDTRVWGLHADFNFNILNQERWKVFVAQGVGFINLTPFDQQGNDLTLNENSRKEGEEFKGTSVYFPTTLGTYYLLKNGFGVGFQFGLWNTLSDYLDNLSAWSEKSNNDQVMEFRLMAYIPLKYQKGRRR